MSDTQIYEFGSFRIDVNNRILLRGDRAVHLTDKVFNVLLLLIQKSGHLVTKEELMERVWPDSVVEENNLTVSVSALRKALGELQKGGPYIETVSKRGYRFVAEVRELMAQRVDSKQRKESQSSTATTTLAVLPLVNISNDPNLEYLSDGITESIMNTLSKLPQLKVLARSTMFRFKHTEMDLLEVGRQLEAHAILSGRILQLNEQLIIKLELINISEGSQIWGEQYKRKSVDIFEVQEEISQEVSEKLKLRLTGEQKRQLIKRYTEDIEAYHLYLKGRYSWNKRTGDTLKMAIEFFTQAIAKDPDYAMAYAGLGDSYAIIPFYSNIPPKPAFGEAKKATDKALELDDTLAEAHATLAYIKEYYEWDWIGAGEEYKKAINLNPNYATARQWYGMYFMKLGQFERARRELRQALRFDPHSLIINSDLGLPFYFKGECDEAIEVYRRVLDIDRDFIWARFFLGWTYERCGKFPEAIAEFQAAKSIDNRPEVSAMIAHTYAVSGKSNEAISMLNTLKQQSKNHYISPYYLALICVGLGNKEEALAWLEKAYSDRNEWLVWLKVDPRFSDLEGEPQFAELLKRIGFSKSSSQTQDRDHRDHRETPPADKSDVSGSYITPTLIGLSYLEKGLLAEAITELQRAPAAIRSRETSALLGYAFAASGRRDEARTTLKELQQLDHEKFVDPAYLAVIYTGLKDKDSAFQYLEKAYENRSAWLALLSNSSLFDSLRSDPRFTDLLSRLGKD
jgi:TolB-like protein/Flp pilus assembly protein TadD